MGKTEAFKMLGEFITEHMSEFRKAELATINLATDEKGLLCIANGSNVNIITLLVMAMNKSPELEETIKLAIEYKDKIDRGKQS